MLTGPEKSQHLIAEGAGFPTLVETGTADHTNVLALATTFEHIYTIELDDGFYRQAVYGTMNHPNITCVFGDSAVIVEDLAYRLHGPVLWWLDAHYCGGVRGPDGDTPIEKELNGIWMYRSSEPNRILIDDARLFGTDRAYPTLDWVRAWGSDRGLTVDVRDDIIHLG